MEKCIERFDKYMAIKGLNDNKVTNAVKLSNGSIGKCRKSGGDMSKGMIARLTNYYTDLSIEWLISGKGEMLKKKEISATIEKNSVSEIEYLRQRIEFQEQLILAKDKLIEHLEKSQNDSAKK